jgi:hypothetical protein
MAHPPQAALSCERGDVIVGGLLKIVVGLIIFGLIVYEAGAITVNQAQLDDQAQSATLEGLGALATGQRSTAVEQTVHAAVDPSMAVDWVAVDQGRVTVTLSRQARVLLLDRLGPLADLTQQTATHTSQR